MDPRTALDGVVAISCADDDSEVVGQLLEVGRDLMTAPVGVAILVDAGGTASALVHSGISVEELALLPHLPSPVGLITVVLGGGTLRLEDLSQDPRSVGLLNALEMRRLLATPLWIDGRVVGAVFLARRADDPAFGAADEEQLTALCRLAAARLASLQQVAHETGHHPRRTDRPQDASCDLDPASSPAAGTGAGASAGDDQDPDPTWRSPVRLLIHVQPIVDLAAGRTVGYEALSRFPDAHGTCRSPEVVFDEATRHGHGVELERRALSEALAVLPLLPRSCYLSVNLSPQALLAPAVFAALSDALRRHPGRLVVELTEHAEVLHYPALVKTLAGLRAWGLRLAVDDMGSGFASLRHVTMLHPDMIKLDKEFIHGIHADRDRRAVAKAIITFAAEIDASFVAEGVETEDELRELQAIGATYGQGYLLGRPASPHELAAAPAPA